MRVINGASGMTPQKQEIDRPPPMSHSVRIWLQ
jgi:hypothetical protein